MTGAHRSDIRRSFDAAAATYHESSAVQRDVAARLMTRLEGIREPARILDAACGTGSLTALLRQRWPMSHITAIDIAPAMLRETRRLLGAENINFVEGDIARWERPGGFDLVASNCALHWIAPLGDAVGRLARMLLPGGCVAFSVMLDGTLCELHAARAIAAPDKPASGRMPTMDELREAAREADSRIVRADEETLVTHAASAAEALAVLRRQGVTGGHLGRGARPLNRAEVRRLTGAYDRHFTTPGHGVAISYRVGYLVAVRG